MSNSESSQRWRELYQVVLVESDYDELTESISRLEVALTIRLEELAKSADGSTERAEIAEASKQLFVIKTEKLGWPGVNLRSLQRS